MNLVLFYSSSLYSFYTHALASIESKWDENQNAHIMSKQYFCGKFWNIQGEQLQFKTQSLRYLLHKLLQSFYQKGLQVYINKN